MEEGEGGRARQRGGARITGVVPRKRVPSSQREELGKNVKYPALLVPLGFQLPAASAHHTVTHSF